MDPFFLLAIGMIVVIGGIVWLKTHAFIALLAAALVVAVLTPAAHIERVAMSEGATAAAAAARAAEPIGTKVASLFGKSCTQLGLLIAMASIVGVSLLASGDAERIVLAALKVFGESRAPLVFGVCGFVLGIPIFFDTVFLLLIPLARAMAARTGRDYLRYVLCIAAGTTMTHSLVPPTPGPLFAAQALKVDLGLMIVGGLALGAITTAAGLLYAWWANLRWPTALPATEAGREAASLPRPVESLPPLGLALLPIVLPVALIGGLTISQAVAKGTPFARVMAQIGQPNVALAVAAAVALGTLIWTLRGNRKAAKDQVQTALADAGTIILVTAAGGIFGGVLQETGVGLRIRDLAEVYRIGVLPLAFFVTALVRVAQGSATVAMVTSVGILSGVVAAGDLGFHPLYVALAIGCGSKLVPWMNDSGFWVVGRMSGFSEVQTLRSFSVMLAIMGCVGFVVILVAARLFPLV
jgi:GntP family gluconate:H+ symporter